MNKFVIAIDIGTQGTKAGLFNKEMELITDVLKSLSLSRPSPELFGRILTTYIFHVLIR